MTKPRPFAFRTPNNFIAMSRSQRNGHSTRYCFRVHTDLTISCFDRNSGKILTLQEVYDRKDALPTSEKESLVFFLNKHPTQEALILRWARVKSSLGANSSKDDAYELAIQILKEFNQSLSEQHCTECGVLLKGDNYPEYLRKAKRLICRTCILEKCHQRVQKKLFEKEISA